MSAPNGNKFWEARSTHGRKPKFETADQLWDACCQYFQWVEDNPLWENKATQYQGAPVDVPIAKMRAMTIKGLCRYIGVNHTTWREFRQREDLSTIVAEVEDIIYEQKFTGAAADLLNPGLIARELGLKESTSVEHSGSVDINQMTDEELDRRLMALINESGKPN